MLSMRSTFSRRIVHLLLQLFLLSPQAWSKRDIHWHFQRHRQMHKLGSRPRGFDPHRKPLLNPLFPGRSKDLKCSSHYQVYREGHIHFHIQSPSQDCFHAFYGSKAGNCTVAVLCEEGFSITPSNCYEGYIVFRDGTSGFQKACTRFHMSQTPRYARNGGKDMYLNVRGSGGSASCVAFCKEDLTSAHYDRGIKKPIKLATNNFSPMVKTDTSCRCGKARQQAGRIVGGDETRPFEFPWIGGLTAFIEGYENFKRIPMCGVSLISDRWVLLASHCTIFDWDGYDISQLSIVLHAHVMNLAVRPGDIGNETEYRQIPGYDRRIETDESEESVRRSVEKIVVHPFFTNESYDWDVALMKLSRKVDIGGSLIPICLPKLGDFSDYPDGSKHTVAGWGLHFEDAVAGSRIMQKLDVELGKCQRWWGGSPRHICAGYLTGGLDACQGDSGGPLMYKLNSEQYVISGIVSAGSGCARRGQLGLYTNVKEVLQWIYLQIGESPTTMCQV